MNYAIHRISLDVTDDSPSQLTISAKQGDNAKRLIITLLDDKKNYRIADGCYATFIARKSNGTWLNHPCIIENNKVIYDFLPATVSTVGMVKCEIHLYKKILFRDENGTLFEQNEDGTATEVTDFLENITTADFMIAVHGAIMTGIEDDSESDKNTLLAVISRGNELISNMEDAIGEKTELAGRVTKLEESASELEDSVTELEESVSDFGDRVTDFGDRVTELEDRFDGSGSIGGGLTEEEVNTLIQNAFAEANYKPIAINSFYASPSVIEIGETASITLSWSYSKTETSQTINGSSVGVGTRIQYHTSVSPNTKYTLYVQEADSKGATATKEITINSVHPFYYGGRTASTITSVDGLTKSVQSYIDGTYYVTLSADGYIYFVCHESESISKITDANTGYGISYEQIRTITRTIGGTAYTYKVYRSVQLKADTYSLKVE